MKTSISCPACNSKVPKKSMFCLQCGANLLIASKSDIPDIGSYDIKKTDTLLAEYNNLKKTLATISDAESLEELQNQHYKALEADYLDLYKQVNLLKAQINSEKLDVEALNKLTWGTLKARITGKMDELLTKEENEYFTALAMYESTVKERDEQKKLMEEAQKQWKEAKDLFKTSNKVESELQRLIDQIMDELDIVEDQKQEKEVDNLKTKLSALNKQLVIMEKNYSYVENAIISYNSAVKKLKEASEHKRWTHMHGHRMLVHFVKDSDITKAQILVNRGNRHLYRAVEELKGAPKFAYAEVKKAGFWSEVLFDGVLYGDDSYTKVQEAITSVNKALQVAKSVAEQYEGLLNPLSKQIKELDNKYSKTSKLLEKERITIIEAFIAKNS